MGAKVARDRVRGAGAGLLHQPDPGDPERRDGAGVERPHLGRREDGQHGYGPWEARSAIDRVRRAARSAVSIARVRSGSASRVDALPPWTTSGVRRDTTLSGC